MQIIELTPPNYEEIKSVLNPPPHSIFVFGDKLYNPSKRKIEPDILFHESVHVKQQGTNPEVWWTRYLYDHQFRYEQELEAYAKQYQFVKRNLPARISKIILDDIVDNFHNNYKTGKNRSQLETSIRKYEG